MIANGNTKLVNALGAVSSSGAYTCNVIDTAGYDRLTVIVNFGLIGAGDYTVLKLTESDVPSSATALGGTPNDVPGAVCGTSLNINGAASVFPGNADDGKLVEFQVDLRGRKRYILLAMTAGAAALASATGILSRAEQAPVTMAERGVFQGFAA